MINMPGISIVVCCYNGVKRLKPTLLHIAQQNIRPDIGYELIIVDNASDDNTADFAHKEWETLNVSPISFKVVPESNPGLSNARKKGIAESTYDYLIFCDDDNWLAPDYANIVFDFFQKNPQVAVAGGFGEPVFDENTLVPDWFDRFSGSFAVGPQASDTNTEMNFVYGASMAIKKSIFNNAYFKTHTFLDDRKGKNLSAGGDGEICYKVKLMGYKVAYLQSLKFKHHISEGRLNWPYLKRLQIGFAESFVALDLYLMAISNGRQRLPGFYWLKKMFYYYLIYLKYWPTHFSAYSKASGTIEEIRHITWKTIALSYLKYNFETVEMYRKITSLKTEKQTT